MVRNPFKKAAKKAVKQASRQTPTPTEVSLGCDKREKCAPRQLEASWDRILRDHKCANKYLPPVYKKLGSAPAATDLHSIFMDPSLFANKCGDYGTIFETPSGCLPLLESVALSAHELGHPEYVERSQSEGSGYRYAVLKGIKQAGKNPTPNYVQLLMNVISDELLDWRLFDGAVKGAFDYEGALKWLKPKHYSPGPRSLLKAHFAIEDDLSGGAIGVDDTDVRDVKDKALRILRKNRDRDHWPVLFEQLAELFARNFDDTSSGRIPIYTPGPVDGDTFTLPPEMLEDPGLTPADVQTVLDSMNPGGTRWGGGSPVPPDPRYSKDTLRLYYRQLSKYIRFSEKRVPEHHVVKAGVEVWTPEKALPNITESVYRPLFLPREGEFELSLLPFINIQSDVHRVQSGPDYKAMKKPRLLIIQDESSSMGSHGHGTKTWYRSIGTMSAVRSAVRSGMSACVVGFSETNQYHVNERPRSSNPWTRNLTVLDDASIHNYYGGDTQLPDVGWVAGTTKDPILSILYTDGGIGNLSRQLPDLSNLSTGKNRMVVFLIGDAASGNEVPFQSIGAVTYKPKDLKEFLFSLNQYTSSVYGGTA